MQQASAARSRGRSCAGLGGAFGVGGALQQGEPDLDEQLQSVAWRVEAGPWQHTGGAPQVGVHSADYEYEGRASACSCKCSRTKGLNCAGYRQGAQGGCSSPGPWAACLKKLCACHLFYGVVPRPTAAGRGRWFRGGQAHVGFGPIARPRTCPASSSL